MILILWILGWLVTVGLVKEYLSNKGEMFHGSEWLVAVVVLFLIWPFVLIATLWSRWKNK